MAAFEAWLVFLILVVNVVGKLQRKRTLAASRGFLAAARLSCFITRCYAAASRLSICLSVTLMCRDHIGQSTSEIISLLGVRSSQTSKSRIYSQGNTPKFCSE